MKVSMERVMNVLAVLAIGWGLLATVQHFWPVIGGKLHYAWCVVGGCGIQ